MCLLNAKHLQNKSKVISVKKLTGYSRWILIILGKALSLDKWRLWKSLILPVPDFFSVLIPSPSGQLFVLCSWADGHWLSFWFYWKFLQMAVVNFNEFFFIMLISLNLVVGEFQVKQKFQAKC